MTIRKNIVKYGLEIACLILYLLYSIMVFSEKKTWSYSLMSNMPVDGLATVYLDENPYYQVFEAHKLVGVRLVLRNDDYVSEGAVVIEIGNYTTGESFYHEEISASKINGTSRSDYIDFYEEISDFEQFIKKCKEEK